MQIMRQDWKPGPARFTPDARPMPAHAQDDQSPISRTRIGMKIQAALELTAKVLVTPLISRRSHSARIMQVLQKNHCRGQDHGHGFANRREA